MQVALLTAAPAAAESPRPASFAIVGQWDSTLAALGRSPETRRSYRYGIVRFLSEVCPESIDAVTEQDVVTFFASLGSHASARSMYYRALRAFFGWATRLGYTASDPTAFLMPQPVPKPPPAALSDEELTRLVIAAAWKHPKRAWAILACYALGTRRSELCAIRPEDIEWEGGRVMLRVTKGNRPRVVEMGPLARAALEELEKLREDRDTTLGIARGTFTYYVKQAGQDAGLPVRKQRAHILRSTFATRLLGQGVPISVVAELMGHSTVAITTRYLAVHRDDRRRAVELLSL